MKIITVSGRLVKDLKLESRNVNGKPVSLVKFSIANDDDRNGRKDTNPAHIDYYDVTAWGKTAEVLATYLSKGKKVLVTGTPKVERYKNKNGEDRRHFDIKANRVEFMDRMNKKQTVKAQAIA